MHTTYIVITLTTAVVTAGIAVADLIPAGFVLASSAEVGVPRSWLRPLAAVKVAGAADHAPAGPHRVQHRVSGRLFVPVGGNAGADGCALTSGRKVPNPGDRVARPRHVDEHDTAPMSRVDRNRDRAPRADHLGPGCPFELFDEFGDIEPVVVTQSYWGRW